MKPASPAFLIKWNDNETISITRRPSRIASRNIPFFFFFLEGSTILNLRFASFGSSFHFILLERNSSCRNVFGKFSLETINYFVSLLGYFFQIWGREGESFKIIIRTWILSVEYLGMFRLLLFIQFDYELTMTTRYGSRIKRVYLLPWIVTGSLIALSGNRRRRSIPYTDSLLVLFLLFSRLLKSS